MECKLGKELERLTMDVHALTKATAELQKSSAEMMMLWKLVGALVAIVFTAFISSLF